MFRKKNKKIGQNQEMRRIKKSNFKVGNYMTEVFFACYY